MQVNLRKINADNFWDIVNLKVAPQQENFVAPNYKSLAQAKLNDYAWFRGIYDGDEPVGFVMIVDFTDGDEPEYFLWRLMIDEKHQGKGYGKAVMDLLIDHVKTRPGAYCLGVSCDPSDDGPKNFYQKLGFVPTGKMYDDEMELKLTWGEPPVKRPDIALRPVTDDNLGKIAKLKVAQGQEDHVIDNWTSIGESLFTPHLILRGVYLGDEPVGFAMFEDDPNNGIKFLWRLMIDEKHQGKGYGRMAMNAVVEYLHRRSDVTELRTSCLPGLHGPEYFYRGLGFEPNGEVLDDEVVLVYRGLGDGSACPNSDKSPSD